MDMYGRSTREDSTTPFCVRDAAIRCRRGLISLSLSLSQYGAVFFRLTPVYEDVTRAGRGGVAPKLMSASQSELELGCASRLGLAMVPTSAAKCAVCSSAFPSADSMDAPERRCDGDEQRAAAMWASPSPLAAAAVTVAPFAAHIALFASRRC